MPSKTGPIYIAFAYLILVVFIMWFCARESTGFDEYSKYWGLFGTLVGVATGAIPSFFFKGQAEAAQKKADEQTQRADKEASKAQIYAGLADPLQADQIPAQHQELFR